MTYGMAKTTNNPRIVNRTVRAKLSVRRDPYWHLIAEGQHLGYRRTEVGGTWIARYYSREHGRRFHSIGSADDSAPANGTHVFSFQQALDAAQSWFGSVARSDSNGVHVGPYRVADAAKDWLDKWDGSKLSKATSEANVKHWIIPPLGEVELGKLTRRHVENWLHNLADQKPIRVQLREQSTKKLSPSRQSKIRYNHDDPETKRKRRDTANRVFNDLRALLTRAYNNQMVNSKAPWETVPKFKDVSKVSSEGLTLEEAKRFIGVCPSDFLILVQAALITGCRYADLCAMKVKAYEPRLHAVAVKQGKTGEWQRSYLTDEEEAFFIKHIEGKEADDHIFLRGDGEPWGKSNQQERMRDALKAAKINRHIRFHDLRHTLGQWLAESGMDMKVISKQLGHSSVNVTEKHYVRYTPEFLSKTVRESKPSFLGNVS